MMRAVLGNADGPELSFCDVIEHEGQFWLVPHWLTASDGSVQKPRRIIAIASFRHQRPGPFGAHFLINEPVPAVLLAWEEPPAMPQYVVIELPEIAMPIPPRLN